MVFQKLYICLYQIWYDYEHRIDWLSPVIGLAENIWIMKDIDMFRIFKNLLKFVENKDSVGSNIHTSYFPSITKILWKFKYETGALIEFFQC